MNHWMDLAFTALGSPVALCCSYLVLVTVLSGPLRLPAPVEPRFRFRILIPAHDEAAGIAATVTNLLGLDYPRELFHVLVIADNCSDDTAGLARGAGADVLERNDAVSRGKGHALHYAFARLPPEVDAVVVIDADTLASPNLLRAFAARLAGGAMAVQADYAVRNPNASWRTRLMAIALGAFHVARSRARERLGVSAGLRGNGMCFAKQALAEVPHEAYSIVEDVEYGIRLARAGKRVHYADEAHVYGEMVTTAKSARSQRLRWEGGRTELAKRHALRLLRDGLRGNFVLFDLGLDLVIPPLSRIAVLAVVFAAAAFALELTWGGFPVSRAVSSASLAAIGAYVLRGWTLSATGLRGLLDLALAPLYVIWKMTLRLSSAHRTPADWVRTTREPRP